MYRQLLMILGFVAMPIHAQVTSPLSPSLYYDIGGGSSFHAPIADEGTTVSLGLEGGINLPLSCDIWDKAHGQGWAWGDIVEEYVLSELNALGQQVVASLIAIPQGIAVAALQRALPGMYDYSQNLIGQIEAKVGVIKQTCETVVNDIYNGVNPLDPWKKLGASVSWRVQGDTIGAFLATQPDAQGWENYGGASNILKAQQSIAEEISAGDTTIPWFGGDKGGPGDNGIYLVRDMIRAGYSVTVGDNASLAQDIDAPPVTANAFLFKGEASIPQTSGDSRLGELFPNTTDAIEWANKVLGEQTIHLCDPELTIGCDSQFQPGVGLMAMIERERAQLLSAWVDIIANIPRPDVADMARVSSPTVKISPHVYEALSRFEDQDRDLYIERLIRDTALSMTVERALAIRRLLKAASESPYIQAYQPATDKATELIAQIKVEIDDLMWTLTTQDKLTSTVAGSILEYDEVRRQRAYLAAPPTTRVNSVVDFTDRPVTADD